MTALETALGSWSFRPNPTSEDDLIVCPADGDGCGVASPLREWILTETGCEDCGSHEALMCPRPECQERYDHVFGPTFVVLPASVAADKRDACGCHRECTVLPHDCAVPCRWPACLTPQEEEGLAAELAADVREGRL